MKNLSTPRGIRIPVASVKGRCPRPLDDGGYKSKIDPVDSIVKYLTIFVKLF